MCTKIFSTIIPLRPTWTKIFGAIVHLRQIHAGNFGTKADLHQTCWWKHVFFSRRAARHRYHEQGYGHCVNSISYCWLWGGCFFDFPGQPKWIHSVGQTMGSRAKTSWLIFALIGQSCPYKGIQVKISSFFDMGAFKPISLVEGGNLTQFSNVHVKVNFFILYHQDSFQSRVILLLAAF